LSGIRQIMHREATVPIFDSDFLMAGAELAEKASPR
jgi:hypothetical protein